MICKMIETKVKRRRCFEDICEDGSISERTQYRLFPQVRRDLKYFSTERLCTVQCTLGVKDIQSPNRKTCSVETA